MRFVTLLSRSNASNERFDWLCSIGTIFFIVESIRRIINTSIFLMYLLTMVLWNTRYLMKFLQLFLHSHVNAVNIFSTVTSLQILNRTAWNLIIVIPTSETAFSLKLESIWPHVECSFMVILFFRPLLTAITSLCTLSDPSFYTRVSPSALIWQLSHSQPNLLLCKIHLV